LIFNGKEYTHAPKNGLGYNNHFQGIIYFESEDAYILSGGNENTEKGELFISSKHLKDHQEFHSRVVLPGFPTLWHAGGMRSYQKIVLVPLERLKPPLQSKILFYDMENIFNPKLLKQEIVINHSKTGAVDIVYLESLKKFLLVAFDTESVSLYRSKTDEFLSGFDFHKQIKTTIFRGANISLLQQCDGKIFLAETYNKGLIPPFLNGKNQLTLYSVNPDNFETNFILKKNFKCSGKCNFRGAANFIIQGGELELISTKMYRNGRKNQLFLRHFRQLE
jgi:hypothetical protein